MILISEFKPHSGFHKEVSSPVSSIVNSIAQCRPNVELDRTFAISSAAALLALV